MVNPAEGTIDWLYDDGLGGPDWQGEAWVEVMDSLGGADADYSFTPDGLGVIDVSASTSIADGSVTVDLTLEELSSSINITNPVNGWVQDTSIGTMFNYFSISPAVPGSTDPIDMYFSFDYDLHLTGQAEPSAPYGVEGSASLLLEYEDEFGDWQLVPDGQLFYSEVIAGSGTDSDDVTFNGQLYTTVALVPDSMYVVTYKIDNEIPEPGTLLLLGFGGLALRRIRRAMKR